MSKQHVSRYIANELNKIWESSPQGNCFMIGYANGCFDMLDCVKREIDDKTYEAIKTAFSSGQDAASAHIRNMFEKYDQENSDVDDIAEKFESMRQNR